MEQDSSHALVGEDMYDGYTLAPMGQICRTTTLALVLKRCPWPAKRYPWGPSSVNRTQKRPRAPILKPSQHKSCWVLFPPRKLHAARSHEGTSTIGGEKDRRSRVHPFIHSVTCLVRSAAPLHGDTMRTPRAHLGALGGPPRATHLPARYNGAVRAAPRTQWRRTRPSRGLQSTPEQPTTTALSFSAPRRRRIPGLYRRRAWVGGL